MQVFVLKICPKLVPRKNVTCKKRKMFSYGDSACHTFEKVILKMVSLFVVFFPVKFYLFCGTEMKGSGGLPISIKDTLNPFRNVKSFVL